MNADNKDLIARLRDYSGTSHERNRLDMKVAADALETDAKTIARLTDELSQARMHVATLIEQKDAIVAQPNEWKEAVLDELAAHALDAPVSMSAREIVAILLETNSTMARDPAINDPMDWPLPCDVTVGHGTMLKGVALRTLVLRMKTLYEMATGRNADEVAGRSLEDRKAMSFDQWWDSSANTPAPDTFKRWEESCRQAWCAGAAQAAQIPGWQLVPIEPTREMFQAANQADDAAYIGGSQHGADIATIWDAMLDAALVCDYVQVDKSSDPVVMIAKVAQAVILAADQAGFVVTIERRPLQPLAMGHTEPVVTIWGKRGVS